VDNTFKVTKEIGTGILYVLVFLFELGIRGIIGMIIMFIFAAAFISTYYKELILCVILFFVAKIAIRMYKQKRSEHALNRVEQIFQQVFSKHEKEFNKIDPHLNFESLESQSYTKPKIKMLDLDEKHVFFKEKLEKTIALSSQMENASSLFPRFSSSKESRYDSFDTS
jgi:hypothetical protein